MHSRKHALSIARSIRTCPPVAVLRKPGDSDAVARHKAICPSCSAEPLEEIVAADELAEKMMSFIPPPQKTAPLPISVGQFHYVNPAQGSWRDNYYYNPPMVMVLNTRSKTLDEIRVAQVYNDILLAGPGDLILDEDMTGGAGDLFVECWNIYTLRSAWLGSMVGMVSQEVLDAVQAMEKDPHFSPPWAALPVSMRDGDPRIEFRKLEVEVAYTFAARAAGELMAEYAASDENPVIDLEKLKETLTDLMPGIRIPPGSAVSTVEDILATARLPEERVRLAAADTAGKQIVGNQVTVANGQVTAIAAVEVQILDVHERDDGLIGFIGIIPPIVPPSSRQLIFRFAESDDAAIAPEDSEYNADTGTFTVTFTASSTDWKKMRIAVIHDES